MAQQNGGQFDPMLFGDYRDPQENVLENNSFGDFFNEAFPSPQDFNTPYNTGELEPQKPLVMPQNEKPPSPHQLDVSDQSCQAVTYQKIL